MHLNESELAAVVHGEAAPDALAGATRHVATCALCAERVAALRAIDRETAALLRLVDHPPPAVRASTVIAAARRRAVTERRDRLVRIAAGVALCVGAAAAALPASPLHRAIVRLVTRPNGRPTSAVAAPIVAPARQNESGIVVAPAGDLVVRLTTWQATGTLRIVVTDSAAAALVSSRGEARFSVQPGRLTVDNRGATENFLLTVPRHAPRVRVLVDTLVVFRKSGDDVSTVARSDGAGGYALDLASRPVRAAGTLHP